MGQSEEDSLQSITRRSQSKATIDSHLVKDNRVEHSDISSRQLHELLTAIYSLHIERKRLQEVIANHQSCTTHNSCKSTCGCSSFEANNPKTGLIEPEAILMSSLGIHVI
jgi:hypothetical protein